LRHYIFIFNNQPEALIIQIYSFKKLHVSGILSAYHQEFSTVHPALVSFMHVFDDRFQAESGWMFGNGHQKQYRYRPGMAQKVPGS
jgi:hypothetical protein